MGASESKLVFKQGIFRLSEEKAIPADDEYWINFWTLPESAEDVFSLFSPSDIRRTRDGSIENLETLLLAVTSRLNSLKEHSSFPDQQIAPERDALNCVRILTRLLPYIYEADHLAEWEERFFWTARRRRVRSVPVAGEVLFDDRTVESNDIPRQDHGDQQFEEAKPLAEELLDTLTDLLFCVGFTLPYLPNAKSNITYAIWQSGVGCKQSIATNKDLESNRCEILRLLLTMSSKSMYLSTNTLPVQGVRTLSYLASCSDKQIVLSVLCSLINTTIKHNPTSWRLPYDHMVWKDSRQTMVVYSLHLLLALLLYPVPESDLGSPQKNYYRHYLGRLHRPEDFQFLADGMTRVLSQPMQSNTYIPGAQKQAKWAPEVIMLYWETLQCNKRFRAFILESNRMHDFVILMLFYAIEHKTDLSWQGVVRMCVFVLQTMSVEPAFGKNLNKTFEAQETLPPSIRLSNFRGSYADFLMISIHALITTSKGRLDSIYPALLAIIGNMAAYTTNLSFSASNKLIQLFVTMSSPSFLLANENNHALLRSLLDAINMVLEHQYSSNANLVYVILKARKRVEALRAMTLEGGQQDLERAVRRRKEGLDIQNLDEYQQPSRSSLSDLNTQSGRSSAEHQMDDGTFAIGDDDDDSDDDLQHQTPSQSTHSRHDSRAPSVASSLTDETLPLQLRGMSEKARGKLPAGAASFSRQNSSSSLNRISPFMSTGTFTPTAQWLESWLPEMPLHTMLTIVKTLASRLPVTPPSFADEETRQVQNSRAREFIDSLPASTDIPAISAILASPSPIRVHLFEWSTLSLGWYTSVLWSLIYTAEMHIAPAPSSTASTISNTVTGNASMGISPVGVWNGTNVKLFSVSTEGKRDGPSLSAPRGAVDAVGTKLVDGVRGLNLGGLMGRVTGSTAANVSSPRRSNSEASQNNMREI